MCTKQPKPARLKFTVIEFGNTDTRRIQIEESTLERAAIEAMLQQRIGEYLDAPPEDQNDPNFKPDSLEQLKVRVEVWKVKDIPCYIIQEDGQDTYVVAEHYVTGAVEYVSWLIRTTEEREAVYQNRKSRRR